MIGRLGPTEIILILVVVFLLFGAKKLPDMARSLGKSARILKSEAKAMKDESNTSGPAASPAPGEQPPVQRTIQSAPGDVNSARPVNEPTDTPQR
ncbi:Sec-independent protein translocase subunit TatA [Streptomyces sp. NPDC002176]|uniref:Sec-independent protein translocase subunit TatA n=1 Tax=Streptomyces sp. NPDC002176 TaxID=3364634 RepID=UPI00384F72DB